MGIRILLFLVIGLKWWFNGKNLYDSLHNNYLMFIKDKKW